LYLDGEDIHFLPVFWSIPYDELLRLLVPRVVKVMGYVNDVGIASVAKQLQQIQGDFAIVTSDIKASFTGKKLSLALHRAETEKTIKNRTYGLCFYLAYINAVCDKAGYLTFAGMIASIGEPGQRRRLFLGKVLISVIMNAVTVYGYSLCRPSYVTIVDSKSSTKGM
uniref:Uncharacterized protein n=1 Tax=Glossina palpalis gambiensis TaxID=67801 RepID=A0A1B0BS84_9MUSC